jgi:hypothetical protein
MKKLICAIAIITTAVLSAAAMQPVDDAAFVQATVVKAMAPGARKSVTVVMKNTGTTTWTRAAGHRLGSQSPHDNLTFAINRVDLPHDVPPQGTATFTFEITAPNAPGTYDFQWRMVHEFVAWFGPSTPVVAIQVQ